MVRDYRKYMQSTSSTSGRDYRSSMSRLNEAEQQKQQELVNSAAPLQPTVSRTDYAALGKSLQPSNVNDADPRMLSNAPSPLDASAGITAFQRSQPQPVQQPKQFPGRDLPVIGPVLKGLDKFSAAVKPVSDFLGEFYTPGGGIGAINSFGGAIESGLARVAPKLALGTGLGAKAATGAIREAATSVPLTAGNVLAQNPNVSGRELAKQTAFGAGLGALGGATAPALGKVIANLFKRNGIPEQQAQEALALPMGREDAARLRSVQAPGTEPVVNPYTFGLPEGNAYRMKNIQEARQGVKEIDKQINELNTAYEQAVIDEYNFLKQSLNERVGVQQGQLQRNSDGDVIGRTGRISNNPLWYQQYFAEHGRAPSNKELYRLARERVDKGAVDESGGIPAWKAQNNYDEIINALSDAKRQMNNSLREYDPAINVTNTPLVSKELKDLRRSGVAKTNEELSTPVVKNPIQEKEVEEIVNAIQQPRVRDRVYQYLDEAEKNARTRIQARKNRLSSTPVDTWADYTIIGAAKMGKGTIKLADWTEEMVKEFGDDFRKVAPRIYKASKEELRKQERLASKEGEQARIFNESGTGDETTFDQKISRGAKKSRIPFAQKLEQIRTQFVDDLAPLEGLEKRITGGVQSAEKSLYKSARLFKGVPDKARQIVTDKLSNVINAVEKAGYSADDLGRYALAKHAKDVNAAGFKSGFTNAEIDATLRKYGTPEMESAQQALVQVNRDMLQELVNSGVVSKELADVLDERWKNYIPLFRSFEDDSEAFAGGMSKALANVASPIKALKGSERAVIDPLENMVKNIYQSVNSAERNKVARQLAKLAESDPEGKFIRKLGPDEQVGRKNVVNVKENGENIKYEVEPDVYRAMLNLDQESSNMLVNILSKPASLLRAGATLTPEFAIRNPLRDINQAYITSKSGFNPFIDFPVGLIQSITGGKWAKEFVENNGAYGNLLSMDRNAHREALQKVLKEPVNKKFVNVVSGKSLLRLLRAISDTTESATKIGEYRKAIKKGATPQEAAYRARDLMDFARAGSGIRQANRIVAFLNANIQGKSKLFRAIKENPIRTTTRMITSVTVPTIGVYLLNREFASDEQKQTIADSPHWLKDSFWLVAIPGTDKVARLPKPFDVAPLFANLPEKVLEYVETKDPAAFDGFAKRTLSEGALPMQISGLLPLIEGMSGYSFFRQGDIVPRREQGLEYKDQYDPVRTTETAKLLAGISDKITGGEGTFKNFSSPRIMDNTIQGLTAGLGGYATSAIDSLLKGKIFGWQAYKPLINKPEAPEKRLEQQPLARAFLVDPLQSTRTMDKLYTEKDQLAREKASAKLSKQPFTKNKNLSRLENATEKLSKINKAIRAIESNQLLSAKQKREQIEPLLKQRNDLSRQTMKGR